MISNKYFSGNKYYKENKLSLLSKTYSKKVCENWCLVDIKGLFSILMSDVNWAANNPKSGQKQVKVVWGLRKKVWKVLP